MSVVIETTVGDITVDLFVKERPNTCLNFLKLCKMKYYNLCLFYKVERNFIAQSGDPTATGRGGESIFSFLYGDQAKYFDSELKPRLKHQKMGTISMVNNGNNMNGSQFFLTLGENITYLDEVHTVFGEVTEGFDIILKLNEAICDTNNRPYQDIRITHTVVLHDPYDDPAGLQIPEASPEPTREMLETDYIAPDEEIDDTKGKNMEELEEKIKESEAQARATILEMVGDIPDADVKPPENVLFVCKLNPVTESKDLELIFSRFGPIKSCEVIKDKKSGDSLQYAFIEFENEEDCENAYFKMDNVLIDDRRIHVDFSQSVSKLNFDQKMNFAKEKSNRVSNLKIKDDHKVDGYEMIFDLNSDSSTNRKKLDKRTKDSSNNKLNKHKDEYSHRKEKSKYSHIESSTRSSHKRYRSRSPKHRESRKIPSEKLVKTSAYRDKSFSPERTHLDYKKLYDDSSKKLRVSKHSNHDRESSYSPKRYNKDFYSEQRSASYRTKTSTSKSNHYSREINSLSPDRKKHYYHKKNISDNSYKSSKYDSSSPDRKKTDSHRKEISADNRSDKKSTSKLQSYDKKHKVYISKYDKEEEPVSYRNRKRNSSSSSDSQSVSSDYKNNAKKSNSRHTEIVSESSNKKKSNLSKRHRSHSKSPERLKYISKTSEGKSHKSKNKKHYSSSSSDSSDSDSDSDDFHHKSVSRPKDSHKKIYHKKSRSKRSLS